MVAQRCQHDAPSLQNGDQKLPKMERRPHLAKNGHMRSDPLFTIQNTHLQGSGHRFSAIFAPWAILLVPVNALQSDEWLGPFWSPSVK